MPPPIIDKQEAPVKYSSSQDEYEDEIDSSESLGILIDGKWIIVLAVLATLFLGATKAYLEKPVFSSDVLLQVNERSESLSGMEALSDLVVTEIPVMAEIELIKSAFSSINTIAGKAICPCSKAIASSFILLLAIITFQNGVLLSNQLVMKLG